MNRIAKKIGTPIVQAIKGGFLHILSGNILTKAIMLISSILITRLVTKELYAYYSYAINLYAYVELLNGLELSGAVLILCSRTDSIGKGGAYLKFCTIISTILQLVVSVGLCVVTTFVHIAYPEARRYIYLYMLVPALSVVINNIQSYNRAYGQNRRFSAMGVVRAAVVTLLTLVLAPFIQIEGLIIARYVACVCVIFIGGFFCLKNLRGVKIEKIDRREKIEIFKLGLTLLVANFFSYLMPLNEAYLVDTLIADPIVTANFKIAGLVPQQLSLVAGSICIYFYPSIARAKDYMYAWKKTCKIGLFTAAVIIATTVVGILTNPFIIRLLYGNQYLDAISLTNTLWIMRMAHNAFRAVPISMLPALGDTKFNFIASPIFCLVHVIIDYFMIKSYGIDGVAYATVFVYVLYAAMAWGYLYFYCKKQARTQQVQT